MKTKPITPLLVALSLFWIDVAYIAATNPPPFQIVKVERVIDARPANFIVPFRECARTCYAKSRATHVVQNTKPVTAGKENP